MELDALAQLIDGTAINQWVDSTYWLWPLLEITHFIGLSLLMGVVLIVDARLAGFLRAFSIREVHRLLPLAVVGFVLNLVSGLLFFCGDPYAYAGNLAFRCKLALVFLVGLNALLFAWKIVPAVRSWPEHGDTTVFAKLIGYASIALWLGVLLLGRLIPYIGSG